MKAIFILNLFFAANLSSSAQIYWSKQLDIGQMQNEYLLALGLANDGNIMVGGGGVKTTPIVTRTNIYGKIDSKDGMFIYSKSFPLIGGIINLKVLNNGNETILEGPFRDSLTSYNQEVYFTKINNANGDTIFNKVVGAQDRSEWPHFKMIQTTSNRLAMIGNELRSIPVDYSNISFMMADTSGELLFSKHYTLDSLVNHFGTSVIETPDKGFIILGFNKYDLTITIDAIREMILIKTDSLGNQLWSKLYKASSPGTLDASYLGSDIVKKQDGNYLICGFKEYEFGNGNYTSSYQFTTINENGELIDSVSYDHNFNSFADHIIPTSDGNYLVSGYERPEANDPKYGMLMKVTPDMKILWKRLYRTSPPQYKEHDEFFDVIEMPDDHGFVLCSASNKGDSTLQNGWVIRLDSLGCLTPGCDTLVSTTAPTPDVVAGITVFPNPTSDEVTVETEEIMLGYRLVDMSGRVLQDVQYLRKEGVRAFSVSLAEEAAGVYLLAVHTERGWLVKKVVKT